MSHDVLPPLVSLTPLLAGKRLLIVDDDPDICEVLTELLTAEGYAVDCASDGVEALAALVSAPPDAVFLDVNMPIMDGYEFLRRRDADPRLAKIPIIIMGASALRPEATSGLCISVLPKPIDFVTLLARLALLGLRSVPGTNDPEDVPAAPRAA